MRERQRSQSPPTYQVYETKDGRLVNRLLQVQWPNHPIGNKKLFDGYILKEINEEEGGSSEASSTTEERSQTIKPLIDQIDSMTVSPLDESKYIGAATLATVNEKLCSNDFIIFYQLPDIKNADIAGGSVDDILPSNLPLLLAYCSSQGKNYYLPIKREKHRWWIKFPNGQNHNFSTMQDLIDHYYTYGFINQATGKIDIFRLNLLENVSE